MFSLKRYSLISLLGLSVVSLNGCFLFDSESDPDSGQDTSELLIVNDGPTLRAFALSGASAVETGSATLSIPGTYSRTGNTVTINIENHNLSVGESLDLDFDAGTGGTATDGIYLVTSIVDSDSFTVTDSVSGDITDGVVARTPSTTQSGTYSQSGTTVTVTINNHGIPNGSAVQLNFITGGGVNTSGSVNVVDANTFTVTVDDSQTISGDIEVTSGVNYTQFFAVLHPSAKWIYTTSMYHRDWGNGMINRFAVDWSTGELTYEKSFYAQTDANAADDNAPTGLQFSADGNYLFVHDDDLDGIAMWSVDGASGDISYLASSAGGSAYLHGLSVNSSTTRVFNGDNVFTVDTGAPSITLTSTGTYDGGNSAIRSGNFLYSADDNSGWGVRVFDLTTEDSPAIVDSYITTEEEVREVSLIEGGYVTSGWCGLRSYNFDGTTITPAAIDGSNEYTKCNGTFVREGQEEMFRNLDVSASGNWIASAYYENVTADRTGGIVLLGIDANKALTYESEVTGYTLPQIAEFIQKP